MSSHPFGLRVIRQFCLAAGLSLILLCPGNPASVEAYATVVVEKAGAGREYKVQQGQPLSIRLPENPTTGYLWDVEFYDSGILGEPATDFAASGEPSEGEGGIRTFTFEARSPGTTLLRIILKRSWEPEDRAIDRFEITVEVRQTRP